MDQSFLLGRVLMRLAIVARPSRSSATFRPLRSVPTADYGSLPTSSAAGTLPCPGWPRRRQRYSAGIGSSRYRPTSICSMPTRSTAEADIEGLDYADGYLWFTGSHASKRKKPKGKDRQADLARLSRMETEPNRYLLGRIPLIEGLPAKRGRHPDRPKEALSAARLAGGEGGNVLIEALLDDPHLGSFLRTLHGERGEQAMLPLASKENGFDIEGLAAFGPRLFLGLRGPVLRGWAMLLAIEPEIRGRPAWLAGDQLRAAAIPQVLPRSGWARRARTQPRRRRPADTGRTDDDSRRRHACLPTARAGRAGRRQRGRTR